MELKFQIYIDVINVHMEKYRIQEIFYFPYLFYHTYIHYICCMYSCYPNTSRRLNVSRVLLGILLQVEAAEEEVESGETEEAAAEAEGDAAEGEGGEGEAAEGEEEAAEGEGEAAEGGEEEGGN
jgi:hypothetical protein